MDGNIYVTGEHIQVEPDINKNNGTPSVTVENTQLDTQSDITKDDPAQVNTVNIPVSNNVEHTPSTDDVSSSEPQPKTPLIVIPLEFWLVQPHETVSTASKPTVQANSENMTGGNKETKEQDSVTSGASEQSVMSNVKQKVAAMFENRAKQNKCYVPIARMSNKMIRTFQPSKKSPEIDPYSSLKDVGDSEDKSSNEPEPESRKYNMRE